jgi:hypothetical protein
MHTALRPPTRTALLFALGLSVALGFAAPAGALATPVGQVEFEVTWIADRTENICGLDDAKTLSNPAKVDYDTLLKATAEWKKMKDEKIDPNSAEGIQLRQKASERVRDACEKSRSSKGYCSVWKTIRHADGRSIPDITDAVKEQL